MKDIIKEAIEARKSGKPELVISLLSEILKLDSLDAIANYQTAWAYDSMGQESEAVTFYEKAIANGLVGEDRRGALLGLGSTYRCLGEYAKSKNIFDMAITEFPDDRAFKVFRALSLYNLGKASEAMGELLIQLLDTTSDSSIKSYDKALRFYSDKLNETWINKEEWKSKDESYLISSDETLLNLDHIHSLLADAYWCRGIPKSTLAKAMSNSLCFGIYKNKEQIGFARVVTDSATFAWLCDVIIAEKYRGQDLSKELMRNILLHPNLKGLRRLCLVTKDAHELYKQFGFKVTETPQNWMEIKDNEIYFHA